jgi:hypothetical protein
MFDVVAAAEAALCSFVSTCHAVVFEGGWVVEIPYKDHPSWNQMESSLPSSATPELWHRRMSATAMCSLFAPACVGDFSWRFGCAFGSQIAGKRLGWIAGWRLDFGATFYFDCSRGC